MQKHPGARSDDQCPQPFTLDIAALAALDAALARDHAAQARAERAQAKTPWEEQGVHVSVWVSEALL